ncbi:family 10 glycosylhydrolase [Puniceicoccaceae bacterium K14]|nr:family 10 glycosylhydrolase [Puniceicoccaceae bacterium K14]
MKYLKYISFLVLSALILPINYATPVDLSSIDPGEYDSTWYNRKPIRLIQTNLREIDAAMNIDAYVEELVDTSVNAVLFNVGGIRASYPTEYPFHYLNPYSQGDLVGEVIEKLHENGIKFIARFDMSKVNESIATQHPEWLYVGTDGKNVNYNGEVHTCFTGEYQQEHAFKILEEAISAYPFDGVFFNSRGFQTSDYNQVEHGLCQCNNCATSFKQATGLKLPIHPDVTDSTYLVYRGWQRSVRAAYTERVKTLFKTLDPELVYMNAQGPLRRSESGTPFTSADYWTYSATENTKRILDSNTAQMPADNFNYHMGMDYRHIATSPNIARVYLAQHMLNGAGPAVAFSGRVENQLDRVFIPKIKELFAFHKTYEKLFTNVQSVAKVGLVMGSSRDYRGIMRILTEEHIMYDLLQSQLLGSDNLPKSLDSYDVLILSNVTEMSDDTITLIDDYVKGGGKLLATGSPGVSIGFDVKYPREEIALRSLGIMPQVETFAKSKSTYLKLETDDKFALGEGVFNDFDVVMMHSDFLKCQLGPSAKGYMGLVPNAMHGPPEKCYFTDSDVTEFSGLIFNTYGQGRSVFIPWQIGVQYNWKGNNAHRELFRSSLLNLLGHTVGLVTDSSPLIEMTHIKNCNGAFEWFGMINHSGQIGNVFRDPIPVHNSTVRFKPQKPVESLYLLCAGIQLDFTESEGWIEYTVPEVDDFEMVLCLYK